MARSAATSRPRRSTKPRGLRACGRVGSGLVGALVMAARLAAAAGSLKAGIAEGRSLIGRLSCSGGTDEAVRKSQAPSASAGLGGVGLGHDVPLRTREGRMMVGAVMVREPRHDGGAS